MNPVKVYSVRDPDHLGGRLHLETIKRDEAEGFVDNYDRAYDVLLEIYEQDVTPQDFRKTRQQ